MTSIDFYQRLSQILDNFKNRSSDEDQTKLNLVKLNEDAKAAGLDLSIDSNILDSIREEVQDSEYYDDNDDESYDSYDESYDED